MNPNPKILLAVIVVLSMIIILGVIHIATLPQQPTKITPQITPIAEQTPDPTTTQKEVTKTEVKIKSVSPSGATSQFTTVIVDFTKPIADQNGFETEKDISDPLIKFTPEIRGQFRWTAADQLQFLPEEPLIPSAVYTAEIDPNVVGSEKFILIGARTFRFATERFKIINGHLDFEFGSQLAINARILGEVEFNYPVDLEELKKHLAIFHADKSQIDFQLRSPNSTTVSIETDEISRTDNDQQIQLIIGKNFTPINGQLGLHRDYKLPIVMRGRGDLVIESAHGRNDNSGHYFNIRFSSFVDVENLKNFIVIDPETDLQITTSGHFQRIVRSSDFKPGNRYALTIRSGLTAADHSVLKSEFRGEIVVPDLDPSLRFVGDGFYLPRNGNLNIGLATINIDKSVIGIEKVFYNNVNFLASQNWSRRLGRIGKRLHSAEIEIDTVKNDEVTTPISLKNFLDTDRLGIFKIVARDADHRWRYAHQWVVITDLGILAKRTGDELLVWVNSLSTLEPISNVKIELISENNQTLISGRTDQNGFVKFTNVKKQIDDFTPFMITARKGDDLSFIQLDRTQISTTDFAVSGSPYLEDGYDAFIYTDRGIYRPGESAEIVAILRGKNWNTPPQIPVTTQIFDPTQNIVREFRSTTDQHGSIELKLDLPDYAKTGQYTAKIFVADQEIGRRSLRVEEFMPDRVKVKIETDDTAYELGDHVSIEVEGVNLFGPPAADMRTTAICDLEFENFAPKKYRSFTFVNPSIKFKKQRIELGEAKLDQNGKASFSLDLPNTIRSPSMLKGILISTVHEPGGRAVSAYKRIDVHAHSHYVGIRRKDQGYAELNAETEIKFVGVDQNGEISAGRDLEVIVYKMEWNSILRRDSRGRYRYISEKNEIEIVTDVIKSQVDQGLYTFTPKEWGEYRIEFRDRESDASSSISFYASGWGYAPWAMDNPDRLEIDFDQENYKIGEIAKVQIKAPFSGKLIMTIEKDRVLSHRTITMNKNTAVIDLAIKSEFRPNAFVSATLIRSTKSLEKHAPARAFGVAPISVNTDDRRMAMTISAPDQQRPQKKMKIDFHVDSDRPVSATISAIDEGILQLTNFKTPDAHDHFFRQRRLGVQTNDLYSAILPEIVSIETEASTGGDGIEAGRKRRLSTVSVTRVKPIALWSGVVRTDWNGNGSVEFDVPQFNGTLRVMAVAFAEDRFASASHSVIVRDAIVLTPTFPRALAGGDRFEIPVRVFNGTGSETEIEIELKKDGFVEVIGEPIQKVSIAANSEIPIFFEARTYDAIGEIKFTLSANGNGESTQILTSIPLRPAAPLITRSGSGNVSSNGKAEFIFPSDLIAETAEYQLTVTSSPATKFANGVSYLLTYPHGCLEQTTSKVFPLLYFKELANAIEPDLFQTNNADYFINEGIRKIESMTLPTGYFAYWHGGNYSNHWSSVYAANFLVEAREAGYEVSDRVYDQMLRGLRKIARDQIRNHGDYDRVAYACYVLALAGEPEKSVMNYLKNYQKSSISFSGWFHLAGAFGLTDDLRTAIAMMPSTYTPPQDRSVYETGGNFTSPTRAEAIMLNVLIELDEDHSLVPKLIESLSNATSKNSRWHTTQENAFAFLAIGKAFRKKIDKNYSGKLLINGSYLDDFTSEDAIYVDNSWSGAKVEIDLEGSGNCYFYWTATGVPTGSSINEFDNDLIVRRRYLTENGDEIVNNNFQHGSLVVAEIEVRSPMIDLENVAIVDVLPAGLEIENPRIESRAGIPWIKDQDFRPDYMDIRDDRLIFFGKFRRGKIVKFYYALRAVTKGNFTLPPIAAEAMYDASKASVASSGRISVVTK